METKLVLLVFELQVKEAQADLMQVRNLSLNLPSQFLLKLQKASKLALRKIETLFAD
jgi:hypothetical protein